MDLVKIGFQINANGLKDANTEVDKLLNRVDKIGSGSKKNASYFENSQKRVKDSSKSTTNEIDKTTKALERQRLIGEYLGQGLDKTTASAIASFRQLGGTTSQVNSLMQSLASNKALVQAQKDAANLASSQNKTKDSVKKTGEEVDKTTKALERQRIIGEYLGKGLDKTTATAIANFKQLGGTTAQVNALISSLASNKALVQAQKDTARLTREQGVQSKAVQTTLANFKQLKAGIVDTNTVFTLLGNNRSLDKTDKQAKAVNDSLNKMRLNLDLAGKGFSASEQAQLRQLKANGASNAELEKAIELIKKRKQAEVLADYQNQKASLSREWLSAYDKEIAARVAKEKAAAAKIQQIRSDYEAKSKQSLGGGILDSIGRQNKGLADMAKYYSNIEAQQKKVAAEAEKAAQNAEKERQKQIAAAERSRQAELRSQATPSTGSGTFDQIKGIAAYALLSTAIYGAITATLNLIAATIKMADEYTSTQQRLKLYIKDAQTLGEVNTFLAKSAIQNNVGLRENAALYAKLSPAMQRIGANTAATNQVVDAFGKSLRIGGATATEAASATIQFAQAMASGKLAGDEFRSISEASPRFLKAIADGSGIAAEKLKEMSSAGALTTEVIARALVKEYHNLTKESESLGYTLEQGTNALKTGFMSLVGEFNEGAGITKYLGTLMAGMGVDMINTAESAKKSGEAFKEWVTSNSDNINKLVDAFQLLTTFLITRYVVAITLARVESMKLAYSTSALAAAQTTAMRSFVIGATAVTAFGRAASAAFTFMGGWAGILLTLAGVAATYLLLRDNAAEATQKLVEQSKYVDITTEAYRKLNEEQRLNARSSVANDMNEVNKKLDEQAKAVERVLLSYGAKKGLSKSELDVDTKDVLDKVTKGVLSYDTALRRLSENKSVPRSLVEDFKKEKDIYDETAKAGVRYAEAAKVVGTSTELAGNKAQNATPLIAGLADKTEGLGDKAEIAGSKFSKFALDLKKAIQDSKDTYDFMTKFDLDEGFAKKLVDRVNQNVAAQQGTVDKLVEKVETAQKELDKVDTSNPLRKSIQDRVDLAKKSLEINKKVLEDTKKAYAAADAPLVQQAKKEAERVAELTRSRNDAGKAEAKVGKEAEKNLKKFEEQVDEMLVYYDVLKRVNNLDIARIASQKEYLDIYKGNLAVANELADLQEKTRQAESRIEFEKSLRTEEESYTRIAALMKSGADYETAKAVANAKFTDDLRGREAAELSITNALTGQAYALSDQINDQETLNRYLKEGLGIEEARFKVALSRIAKLSGGKNVFGEFGEDFENGMKSLRVKRATEASQLKINSLNREAALLTTSMAFSYTAASLAAAKLSASTQGLLYSQAETQLTKQNEVDLIAEQYEISLKISSLLSQDSEVMRDIKSQYPAILGVDAQRLETARKLLEITEAYSAKQQEQKKNPFGDFSNVNFDVFGDIGNPFKEALDGLNALVGGMTSLDEKIKVVRESTRQYQVESELASLSGQTDKAKEMMDLANKQLDLEKDLQKQKAETIDIAYGQGLKFAKSFFKENSKGYKVVSALEMALQAKKIAFALWEKKDTIVKYALELKGMLANAATFVSTTATKIAAQMGFNVAQAQGAVASAAQAPPPVGFASAAAMIALLAGIGIAIGGSSGGSYVDTSNQGTGTVFGDSEAQSASIANSIDLLSENSDLMLPLTSAMLASLRNIESSIGGVTNLILRQATVGEGFNVQEGFKQNAIGGFLEKAGNLFFAGIGDFLGINKMLGSLLGGLFGTKTTIKGQGLSGKAQSLGDTLSGGFDLQEYADVQVKKKTLGITTSTKNKTQFTEADKELEKQFTLIFGGFYDSIVSASGALSANTEEVKTKLENAIIDIGKIDLKGLKGDEIQEKLEAVFGAAADSLAQQGFAGLDDFQQVGEGYFETLIRVAAGVEEAQYYTDQLNVSTVKYTDVINKQGDVALEIVRQSVLLASTSRDVVGGFDSMVESFSGSASELVSFVQQLRELQVSLALTGKDSQYLTQTMIQGAGGIQALSEGFGSYYDMLSAQEQATHLTAQMTEKFRELGHDLPVSIQGYKDLLNSQEVMTASGQKLYGQLIALAPEFTDLQSALKRAEDEANALKKEAEDLAAAERKAAEEAAKAAEEAAKAAEEAAKYAATLSKIRQEMFVTKQSGEYLSEAMIKAAGGTDELSKGLQAYFSMLSPAEQATELTRRMAEQFGALGQTLPSSIDAFRLLVQGLDITTMSGQELYGQLIALAPEFNTLQSSIKAVEDAERNRLEEIARAQQEAAEESARAQREAAEAAAKAAEEARELAKKWDDLRTKMFVTKQSGKNLSQIMINAAGGIDELSSGLESYFSLLSNQEQVEELTRRLNIQFSKLGLALPSTVEEFRSLVEGIDTNTDAGKKLYGQVIALTPQFKELQDMMKDTAESLVHLKFAFEMTGKDAQYLTTSIAQAAGGVDKLSSGLDAYFEMLSPQEKAVELTRRLTAQFNDIGQTLPDSVNGFRSLISSIDVTTDGGKKLYGQVIALAPEFNTLQDALNSSANEVDDLVKSLRDLADEARKARGDQDKPKNLNITRWQFEQAATKAMLGDVEAAQQLLTLGKDLMEISSAYASSSEDYARDLALIQRAATVAADTQANGLGTSSAPTLSPTTGTNTTPTVATTNTTMTTEMKAMREEFNAGLFAIAKYVQNLDSRTERWDDGNRVMVGVLAENGDTPLPVTVV